MEVFETKNFALKKLQIKKEFLLYLENEGIFKELQISAVEYEKIANYYLKKGRFIPPFRFLLKLDLIKIQEISDNLHYLFMKESEASLDIAKEVIYFTLTLIIKTVSLSKSDIQITPLVINLPITCDISELLRFPSYGLESIRGILFAKSSLTKYVRSSVYSCELYCQAKKRRIPSEKFEKICQECLKCLIEDISSADTGDEVICQLIPLKAFYDKGRFQVLKVKIKAKTKYLDELCNLIDLHIGEEYGVIGRLKEDFFEAMNIQSMQLNSTVYFDFINKNPLRIPESIEVLYLQVSEQCPNCPWSFVFALSSMLGSELIPCSSFLNLKIGLMLSLSSQKAEKHPVPLIAVGTDSLNCQYLFDAAGKLAERYVRHNVANSYLGGAAKPKMNSEMIWHEAGQLTLSGKGICNLGDWSKFKKEQINYIFRTIESGQIMLNKDEQEKTNLMNFAPLKCAIWTYWCYINSSKNDQLQLKTLINVFGIPFLAQENDEIEVNNLCRKNLGMGIKNLNSEKNFQIKTFLKDIKEFIKIVNSRELNLSDSASQLIRNYFVVSRRERPDCLPIGAIKTITSLAEAHARLALRDEISSEDVLAIIFLYEETLSILSSESIKPYSKLVWDQNEPIYSFMGKQLRLFKLWLEEYFLK